MERTLSPVKRILFAASLLLSNQLVFSEAPRLVIHEWGTFTSFQDERGHSIGGINTDDEPVPDFVHNIAGNLLIPPTDAPLFFKATPKCHPDVTMRLETPVLYVHGPQELRSQLDVKVAFHGGWLTQYYPDAEVLAPGIDRKRAMFGRIQANTVGELTWRDLALGGAAAGPKTNQPVWLSPRAVDALDLSSPAGESERFLFYRGVGHLDAPLKVERENLSGTLEVQGAELQHWCDPKQAMHRMWLVEVKDDATLAFRDFASNDGASAKTSASFKPSDFQEASRKQLIDEIRSALIEKGLFQDEADALLNTWQASYFQSPGLRLFFLVPNEWTDHVLPLTVSTAADVVRVMVGRIEIVTPAQRTLLKQIAAEAAIETDKIHQVAAWPQEADSSESSTNAGNQRPVSAYQLYQKLGRFRNALLLEEARRTKAPGFKSFIAQYQLEAYDPNGAK